MSSLEDYVKKYDAFTRPTAEIKIGNKKWDSDDILISRVSVATSTGNEAGTCSVELTVPSATFDDCKLKLNSDFSKIKVGVELEVLLGYIVNEKSKTETVFIGYISQFDLEVNGKGTLTLIIQGMDAKMWMMANCRTELKKDKKKYSEAVADLFKNYSAKFKGKKIEVKSEASFETPIYQRNESDYEFVCRAGDITGSLFFVKEGEFYFVSPPAVKSVKLKVSPGTGIRSMSASMSVWGIPKSVEAVSLDRKDPEKVIKAEATSSAVIGDGKSATSLTSNISNVNVIKIIDNTLLSMDEAKFIAESEYNKRELNLVEGCLEIRGVPDIALAEGAKISGFGDPLDNSYIITGVEHTCLPDNYITKIRLKTNRYTPQTSSLF